MPGSRVIRTTLGLTAVAMLAVPLARGANPETPDLSKYPPVVNLTNAQDHQRMADLLGVTDMRQGANGTNANDPTFASYDESKATTYTSLPDPLVTNDGRKVTSADMWWNVRRPEIVEMFDREIYGRMPKETPKVTWEVTSTTTGMTGNVPTIIKQIVGHVDNSAYPLITVNIQLTLTTPANAVGPVPVMMVFGGGFGGAPAGGRGGAPGGRGAVAGGIGGGAATQPGAGGFGRGRGAGGGFALGGGTATQPSGFARGGFGGGPATQPGGFARGGGGPGGAPVGRGGGGRGGFGGPQGPGAPEQILSRGWGYAQLNPGSVQADNGAGLTEGIIGLVNHGQPRKPDDWGALRAWAWGVSRAIDYFETDPSVDAKQIGLEGHSRYGKGTVVSMAYEPRLAIAYVSSSGEGGAHINRRNWGEKVENVGGTQEYHWMAGNFIKYTGSMMVDGKKVVMTPNDMPVDGHELVAMCAPRPVFISGGIEQSDAWQDPKGMFLAGLYATPVYELLGKKGIVGATEFPTPMTNLSDGDVAFREHESGHTDVPNWPYFLQFASRYFHLPSTTPPGMVPQAPDRGVLWKYTKPAPPALTPPPAVP